MLFSNCKTIFFRSCIACATIEVEAFLFELILRRFTLFPPLCCNFNFFPHHAKSFKKSSFKTCKLNVVLFMALFVVKMLSFFLCECTADVACHFEINFHHAEQYLMRKETMKLRLKVNNDRLTAMDVAKKLKATHKEFVSLMLLFCCYSWKRL